MPIMTRMRDSMPVILFGLLIAFVITIVFEWGMDYLGMSSGVSNEIGSVNGSKITYTHFSELLRSQVENRKAQTGVEPDESTVAQLREQVWQNLVTQHLLDEEIARLGITVTDQEIVDWVTGDNPPEDLRQYFIDSTGQFRKDSYLEFLRNPNEALRDPEGVDQKFGSKWLANYEKSLRQRRLQEKLQSVILASVRVSDGETRQRFKDQTISYEALFSTLDPNLLVKDEEVQVTDADLKAQYDENVEQYKFEASRKLKYVWFDESPSAADSLARKNAIDDVLNKAGSGVDFLQLVETYSDKPDSGAFFRHGELSPNIEKAVFAAKVGDLVGPFMEKSGYHLYKVLEEKKSDKEFIHASHILFSIDAGKDSVEVKSKAQDVAKRAKQGEDFSKLASAYSTDPGSASTGGDLGWFGKGRMVPSFEEAAFKAKVGEVIGPIRSQFGLHIIKVHARDMRELKLASVIIGIDASSQTKNDVYDRARDFAYNAKNSDFETEANGLGLEVRETQVQEKGGVVPGIGPNEGIIRWAFKNKVEAVSDPYTVGTNHFVLTVVEVKNAGVTPFDELKESLRPLALRKKKMDKVKQMAADLRAKLSPGESLSKLVESNPSISVQNTGSFTLAASVPGIGRDLSFMGAVGVLPQGEVSQPVVGLRGVYLIQLLSKSSFDESAYSGQKESTRTQMLQEKRNRFLSEWLAKLKDNATIEDNRDTFFR